MSGTLQVATMLKGTNGLASIQAGAGISFGAGQPTAPGVSVTWAGDLKSEKIQPIGTDPELLEISADITPPGFLHYRNNDEGSNAIKLLTKHALAVLAAPATPTIAPQGTTGATSYSYKVTALDSDGDATNTTRGETLASTAGNTTTGNAALSGANFNRVTWAAVTGATGYRVYGRSGGNYKLLVTVGSGITSYDDTGAATPGVDSPATNTTGYSAFADVKAKNPGLFELATLSVYAKAYPASARLAHALAQR